MKKALEAFRKLPESERASGAVKVPPMQEVDAESEVPALPPGGLALRLYARFLAREAGGALRHASAADFPLMARYDEKRLRENGYLFEAHTDFVWLTEPEWKSLVPPGAKKGDRIAVPGAIPRRLCQYHLIPQRLYGEGGGWGAKGIRAAEMQLVVEEASPDALRLRLGGFAKLGSVYEKDKATSPNGPLPTGYEPRFDGVLTCDRRTQAITRFDFVATGDAWGRMGDANNKSIEVERPGRWPLAFAFELAGDTPADRMPPTGQAKRVKSRYFDAKKLRE